MMAMADEDMVVGIAAVEKTGCPIEAGIEVAKKAMEKAEMSQAPDYFYMVRSEERRVGKEC